MPYIWEGSYMELLNAKFTLYRYFLWYGSTRLSILIELMLGLQIMVCPWISRSYVAELIMVH
jgi:hypothetical protein